MKAYIISYFGSRENKDRRERRLQQHTTQLRWLNKIGISNSNIYISSRDYDELEYEKDINYFPYTGEVTRPGILELANSRNVLLDVFYSSNDDWALFLDNDTILDERNKGNIFEALESFKFEEIGIFTPVNPATPGKGAFKLFWDMLPVENNWVFRKGTTSGKMMFIKNVKKHLNKTLYFRPDATACEDVIFGYDMITLGLSSMWCQNIVINELAKSKKDEMVWNENNTSRQEFNEGYRNLVLQWFPEIELKGGKLISKSFFKKYKVFEKIDYPKNGEKPNRYITEEENLLF